MTEPPSQRPRSAWIRDAGIGGLWLLVPPLVAGGLLSLTLRHRELNERFFIWGTYYILFAMLAIYAGIQLAGEMPSPREWIKDNLAGILVSVLLSGIVVCAVAPGFRVLADEANLVGVSKNLFFHRTADFAVTGKWYFENYWELGRTIDRRPALYPFLVSLLHVLRGYHVENAFHVNAIVFLLFVFSCYRLGKALAGELFGVAAAILVAAHPITLLEARSASFDLLATWLLVLVVKSFVEFAHDRTPRQLAILSLNLCLLAHVRVEGSAALAVAAVVLVALRMVGLAQLKGYGFVYSLLPLFMLPRVWQTTAKAGDPEQPFSASIFNLSHLVENSREYLRLVLKPLDAGAPHAPLLIALAAGGCGLVVVSLLRDAWTRRLPRQFMRSAVFISLLLAAQFVLYFSYRWGKPLHPASARLFMWLDTAVAFLAAWLLTVLARQWPLPVTWLRARSGVPATLGACALLFCMHLPAASEARFANALVITREAAQAWSFFEKVGDKRILILSDRPGLFTIMDYGALDISTANANRVPLVELSRHLYRDIYLIQEVDLNTQQPRPQFDAWPDVEKETALEFQSTDSSSIRIARIKQ